MKRRFWFTALGLFLLSVLVPDVRETYEQCWYDLMHTNAAVRTSETIDAILADYPRVAFENLPWEYRERSGMNEPLFTKMCTGQYFYVVHKKDVYRRIVGRHRISEFISRDQQYYWTPYWSSEPFYWGIDERILHKLIDLQLALARDGHDRDAISIENGHRYPYYNEDVGGASKSRHIVGEAIDIHVGDVNQDGRYTDADKQLILDLAEREIIGNRGGIGRYPGTRAVHLDVRGYRARWDTY